MQWDGATVKVVNTTHGAGRRMRAPGATGMGEKSEGLPSLVRLCARSLKESALLDAGPVGSVAQRPAPVAGGGLQACTSNSHQTPSLPLADNPLCSCVEGGCASAIAGEERNVGLRDPFPPGRPAVSRPPVRRCGAPGWAILVRQEQLASKRLPRGAWKFETLLDSADAPAGKLGNFLGVSARPLSFLLLVSLPCASPLPPSTNRRDPPRAPLPLTRRPSVAPVATPHSPTHTCNGRRRERQEGQLREDW